MWIAWTMAVGFWGAAGCSLILDNQKTQCATDSDCVDLGGHPYCQQGVCVASGLGPADCVPTASPQTQTEFLNACTTSSNLAFTNCTRLKVCNNTTTLPPAQGQMTMRQMATVIAVPDPADDELCTKNAPAGGVIYLYGSADFGPLLRAAQPSLYASSPGFRAVFQGSTSCNGVTAAFNSTRTNTLMKDPTAMGAGGWAFYFDESGKQVNCRLDDKTTVPVELPAQIDVGISNLFAQTCNPALAPGVPPLNVSEYTGLAVTFVLSVPATSSEQAISVEAAHLVFGLGGIAPTDSGMANATPWTDWSTYYIRNSGAGSTVLTSLLVDVPRDKFWGVDTLSTENLRDSLLAAPANAVNSSIGILSADFNDSQATRGNLKALYLQAKGQTSGYLPDSTREIKDKVNVRDGHYPLWGYVHLFVPDPNGRARPLVLMFNAQRLEQRFLDEVIAASLTPACAMKVARTSEMGDFVPRTGFQCGCYFDFKSKNGNTSCQACTTSEQCPSSAPSCNYGFCEKAM